MLGIIKCRCGNAIELHIGNNICSCGFKYEITIEPSETYLDKIRRAVKIAFEYFKDEKDLCYSALVKIHKEGVLVYMDRSTYPSSYGGPVSAFIPNDSDKPISHITQQMIPRSPYGAFPLGTNIGEIERNFYNYFDLSVNLDKDGNITSFSA